MNPHKNMFFFIFALSPAMPLAATAAAASSAAAEFAAVAKGARSFAPTVEK